MDIIAFAKAKKKTDITITSIETFDGTDYTLSAEEAAIMDKLLAKRLPITVKVIVPVGNSYVETVCNCDFLFADVPAFISSNNLAIIFDGQWIAYWELSL